MYFILTTNKELANMARKNGDQILEFPTERIQNKLKRQDNSPAMISNFLTSIIGIKPNINGFKYLKFIIEHSLQAHGFEQQGITTVIYPVVAQNFDTTPSKVERSIRHCIEQTFKNNPDAYSPFFGKIPKVPTNSEFIRTIVLYIKENFI